MRPPQSAWVTEKLVRPRAVTPELFSDRIVGVSPAASKAIHRAFKEADLLNATDFLREDPRCAQRLDLA